MIFSNTVTLGNIIELVGIMGGGVLVLFRISGQFATIIWRLTNLETRMERAEDLNMVPINERRAERARYNRSNINGKG